MTFDFNHEDFQAALDPANWTSEDMLHTPTFEAKLAQDGTLTLLKPALGMTFSPEEARALTRFLSEHVQLPEEERPSHEDFFPTVVIVEEEEK